MTFRTGLLAAIDSIRGIAGPAGLDVRTTGVTVRTRTWSGGRRDLGTKTDSDLVLNQYYRVHDVTDREVSGSGGRYEMGDVRVDHITPSDGTIGYTPAQLRPPVTSDATEVIYVLSGPAAGQYGIVELLRHRSFTYQLVLRRMADTVVTGRASLALSPLGLAVHGNTTGNVMTLSPLGIAGVGTVSIFPATALFTEGEDALITEGGDYLVTE